jgi:hypothetical protein
MLPFSNINQRKEKEMVWRIDIGHMLDKVFRLSAAEKQGGVSI